MKKPSKKEWNETRRSSLEVLSTDNTDSPDDYGTLKQVETELTLKPKQVLFFLRGPPAGRPRMARG